MLIKPSFVVRATAAVFEVTVSELTGQARRSHLVKARICGVVVSRRLTGRSYNTLELAWRRDHSSLIHLMQQSEMMFLRHSDLKEKCAAIEWIAREMQERFREAYAADAVGLLTDVAIKPAPETAVEPAKPKPVSRPWSSRQPVDVLHRPGDDDMREHCRKASLALGRALIDELKSREMRPAALAAGLAQPSREGHQQ